MGNLIMLSSVPSSRTLMSTAARRPATAYAKMPLVASVAQKTFSLARGVTGVNGSRNGKTSPLRDGYSQKTGEAEFKIRSQLTQSQDLIPPSQTNHFTTVTVLSLADSSASLTRHVLQAIPSVGPKHDVVKELGIFSSGVGLMLASAVTVRNGIADFNKSNRVGDGEGVRHASAQIVSGTISANSSAFSLVEKVAIALPVLAIASDVFSTLGALINIGVSGLGIYRCAKFNFKIDKILEGKELNERKRVVKTLEFLKNKIVPTLEEQEAIAKKVDRLYPKWGPQEKCREVRKKILDLAEVKVSYFKRRTCLAISLRVLQEIDQHLNRLSASKLDVQSLEAAKELIAEVKSQSKKKVLLSTIVAATSLIVLIALFVGIFFSLGSLPFVLYAISSAITLALLLYPIVTDDSSSSKAKAMDNRAATLAPVIVNLSN